MSSLEGLNIARDTDQIILDTIYISSDDDLDSPKKNANNGEEHVEQSKTYSGPMRARLLPARRGRNIERRKAYTKRWVERKKALLASIGENVSDTDSIASDDVQLSPVQKARAKTNADKEIERQKKIARALKNLEKNLEINLTEKYATLRDKDTDSDTRRTRLSKEIHSSPSQQSKKNSLNQIGKKNIVQGNKSSLNSSMEIPENSPTLTDNIILDGARKSDAQVDDQIFTPYSMKSELVVGDITYAVTSTLILVDPLNNDKQDLNNVIKDSKSFSPDEREKNTDIIDAVQLRRVNPPTNTNSKSNSKQLVERCLNIEVEGNELAVLKRVQYQLADFVEREMKNKLLGMSDVTDKKTDKTDKTNSATHLHQKLDQKLKDIIEIAIKKNIESSVWRKDDCQEFPPTSLKLAMNSFRYQPKVLIKRLDIAKESKRYNIKNAHILKQMSRNKLIGPFSVITRKRQSIPPVRYGDYNTSALDSDSDVSDDNDDDDDDYDNAAIHETPKAPYSRKHGNPATRQSSIITVKSMENKQDEQKADYEEAIRIAENHICGVCGLTFHSRKDVEAHVRTHKVISSVSATQIVVQNENATTSSKTMGKQGKQKMMRCKRCHEIVEARLVKAHVCKSTLHKCYVCDSMFRTKNLLAKHLESHDHSEFNIVNAIGNKKINNSDALLKIISTASTSPQKDQAQGTETATKTQATLNEKNDIQSDKITSTGGKLDSTENVKKPKETYTCFVCDKIFTDEEILKDHLQKHCDDLSEGEQSNSKEQYQCAICGNTLESDQADRKSVV